MDANGLRFWQLAESDDWALGGGVTHSGPSGALRLVSTREAPIPEAPNRAEALLAVVPQSIDELGTYAWYDATSRRVLAAGAVPSATPRRQLGPSDVLTDLAVGFDGVLRLALDGGILLEDLRGRWAALTVSDPALRAFRIASQPAGGALVLDRLGRALWRASGLPLPALGTRSFDGDIFRPSPENADPPRLERLASIAPIFDPVAIATSPGGDTLVLSWAAAGQAMVQRWRADRQWAAPQRLLGVSRPFCMGWLEPGLFVVLVATATGAEAVVFSASDTASELSPRGGVYPLARYGQGPFAHGLQLPVRYPSSAPAGATPEPPRPLVRLHAPEIARSGVAEGARRIDGGQPHFAWHRLYLEACFPEQCGARVWLAASDRPTRPSDGAFHLHVFGDIPVGGAPRGVWSTYPSELPHHPGLSRGVREPQKSGLFSVLIQRTGRRVSAITGRYLWVRVELFGNGRSSPELWALRAYGPRFSYVRRYLPQHYHEQVVAPDSEALAPRTTAADFLERLLLNFEGVLTPLEDRIANAHLLTHPATAPEASLDWLGQWLGLSFEAGFSPAQRRRALGSAAELARYRGTLRGLSLALDVATDDAVTRGEVLVIEDFRLRRTFATILGADLADEDDPLLAGLVRSGNSFVGDSLILSREFRYEFVAVFRDALPDAPAGHSPDDWVDYVFQRLVGSALVDDFFDKLAHRVTVLVRDDTSADRLGMIDRVLELEAPAHVVAQVVRASHAFVVGLASLVGVDTFLRQPEPPRPLRVDESPLGGQALLRRPASLNPRLEGGSA